MSRRVLRQSPLPIDNNLGSIQRILGSKPNCRAGQRCFSSSVSLGVQVIPASYYRGGTSRAVMFQERDLPEDRGKWNYIFRSIIGSPDPDGRQLDGMGGGLSSLSKVCVVSPSKDPRADIDYTFAAIGVKNDTVDYSSNCGNMSSAVGPFAVDNGLVQCRNGDKSITVRILNTNTGKYIASTFPVDENGRAATYGEFSIDGVTGLAAKNKLTFLDPAGSKTGKLLPTGSAVDVIDDIPATCIDVANPCVFVQAKDLGISGDLEPDTLARDEALLTRLDKIRCQAGVLMGLAETIETVPVSIPKIALLSPSNASQTGQRESDITVRAISVGQPHKAVPITVALAVASATTVPGSTAHEAVCSTDAELVNTEGITIAHPTGHILVSSETDAQTKGVKGASVYRTSRRLMSGDVYIK